MPDLVHCLGFIPCKLTILVDSFFLQEVANFVTRVEEVVIPNVVLVRCSELRLMASNLVLSFCDKVMIEHLRAGGLLS